MFQTPAGGRRETKAEGETAIATIAAEVIFPAIGSWRRGEQLHELMPGGSVRIACLCLRGADPLRMENLLSMLP